MEGILRGTVKKSLIIFLFTWVHLYTDGNIYIKYKPCLSYHLIWPVLHAWLHCSISIKAMYFWYLSQIGGKFALQENHVGAV